MVRLLESNPEPPDPKSGALSSWATSAYSINITFYEKNINFIVKETENNLRVDVLINKREELISRTRIKNLILKEQLKLNNEIITNPSKKF